MKNWRNTLLPPDTPLIEVMRAIDKNQLQVALVVDENDKLLGVVSDGDIRRAILKGVPMDARVEGLMSTKFVFVTENYSEDEIFQMMKEKVVNQMPILDDQGRVAGLHTLQGILKPKPCPNWAVIMAGGFGTRLRPMTDDCPKPLLKVGDRPLIETIIMALKDNGIHNIYVTLHYKAEMIIKHLGDGSALGVNIRYVFEESPLGTAGALRLLPEVPTKPMLVMNGDLLTRLSFRKLVDFHTRREASATMCVRRHEFRLPFGVVEMDGHTLLDIKEKPSLDYFINAGIYVLAPEALEMIPKDKYYGMDTLFQSLLERDKKVCSFPIHEYWRDIGCPPDYTSANVDFSNLF